MRWAVVLAGGVGSRFWPVSTAARPKQLLPLASDRPLVADTVARVLPLVPAERILVVTSRALAPALAEGFLDGVLVGFREGRCSGDDVLDLVRHDPVVPALPDGTCDAR